MLYYLLDVIPKIQAFSRKLDETALLTNQHWVSVNELACNKTVFIFRPNEQLIISENGRIERAKWENIGVNSLIIDRRSESYLFKHGFLDETVLALKVDGTEKYALFVNETKYGRDINNVADLSGFLESKYLSNTAGNFSKNRSSGGQLHDRRLGSIRLVDGRELIFYSNELNQDAIIEGCRVTIDGSRPADGFYKSSEKRFEIIGGILINEFYVVEYKQKNGSVLEVDGHKLKGIDVGCRVWMNNQLAPDGKYRTDFLSSIHVFNGLISKN